MVRTTAPLAERMAFNLHDHFATSNDKVGDARLMLAQYRVLRRHSLGNFSRLAHAMARDHAMQWWLDMIGSNRRDPNENFARELMELFTLGVGHYTERDVREAARAFTGYDYDWNRRRYRWNPTATTAASRRSSATAAGSGRTTWSTSACAIPAHAPFLVRKLWAYFIATPPSAAHRAAGWRWPTARSGYELRPVLRMILSSRRSTRTSTSPTW